MAEHFLAKVTSQQPLKDLLKDGSQDSGTVVTVEIGFGTPAENDRIVPDAISAIASLGLTGGAGICFNGRASLPVAMAISHAVAHLYGFVACFDPKMERFIVAVSHKSGFKPGDLLWGLDPK